MFGMLCDLVKESTLTIGNLNSVYSHLSLLVGVPLVSLYEKRDKDAIKLLNPKNTKMYIVKTRQSNIIGELIKSSLLEKK